MSHSMCDPPLLSWGLPATHTPASQSLFTHLPNPFSRVSHPTLSSHNPLLMQSPFFLICISPSVNDYANIRDDVYGSVICHMVCEGGVGGGCHIELSGGQIIQIGRGRVGGLDVRTLLDSCKNKHINNC